MEKESRYDENIPKKVIGVKETTVGLPIASIPTTAIEDVIFETETVKSNTTTLDSHEVINDWEQLNSKRIKGKLRTIGEYVAKQNLSKKYPTTKEIRIHSRISKEYCKKILGKACRIGLLKTHEQRSGHQYRYYVTNIKDYIILEEDRSKAVDNDQEINIEKDLMMPLAILDDLMEHENISFHHISLKSKLRDITDYELIKWRVKSDSNKGKVFELKLSQYRRCVFIVSPNGRVNMIIKCSDDPLYLKTPDDVADFFSICGEIHGVLKAETKNSEPLIEDVPDWKLTQFDAAYDISLTGTNDSDQHEVSNRQRGLLSFSNFGTFRLKYLGHFYQCIQKMSCIRVKSYALKGDFRF
jgi:hypothetical protein